MNLIDLTGQGREFVNLAYVRELRVKGFGKDKVGLTLVFNDASEDTFVVSRGRFNVLEDMLCEMVLA